MADRAPPTLVVVGLARSLQSVTPAVAGALSEWCSYGRVCAVHLGIGHPVPRAGVWLPGRPPCSVHVKHYGTPAAAVDAADRGRKLVRARRIALLRAALRADVLRWAATLPSAPSAALVLDFDVAALPTWAAVAASLARVDAPRGGAGAWDVICANGYEALDGRGTASPELRAYDTLPLVLHKYNGSVDVWAWGIRHGTEFGIAFYRQLRSLRDARSRLRRNSSRLHPAPPFDATGQQTVARRAKVFPVRSCFGGMSLIRYSIWSRTELSASPVCTGTSPPSGLAPSFDPPRLSRHAEGRGPHTEGCATTAVPPLRRLNLSNYDAPGVGVCEHLVLLECMRALISADEAARPPASPLALAAMPTSPRGAHRIDRARPDHPLGRPSTSLRVLRVGIAADLELEYHSGNFIERWCDPYKHLTAMPATCETELPRATLSGAEGRRVRRYLGGLRKERPRGKGGRGGKDVGAARPSSGSASATCSAPKPTSIRPSEVTGCYPHFFCGLSCFLTTLGSDAPGRPWGGNGGELGGRAPRLQFAEGDVAWGAPTPTLLKTRAVGRVGGNGVLLPLNWDRHFGPLNQVRALEPGAPRFADRQPTAVWRGQPTGYDCNALTNPRMRLVRRWGGGRSRLSSDDDRVKIDVAFTSNQGSSTCPQMASRIPSAHRAKELRYQDFVRYKYIISVEGNDVATNVPWLLHTDSVPLMVPPTVEGWLLHADLRPWVHYVPLRNDFADLRRRVRWLEAHPRAAARIAAAGRAYVSPYGNFTRDRQLAAFVLRELLMERK